MNKFVGRRAEIGRLEGLSRKRSASLVVIKGRRRIGKSRLVAEFGRQFDRYYALSGIPPSATTTVQDQLDQFGWQLGRELDQLAFKDRDWNDAFLRLANVAREGRVLILLDEISWMGSKDPHFLGKLKNAWDMEFKKNPNLVLVLCGSISSWIDENILSHTGFLGRISLNLTLEELPLEDCDQFWEATGAEISAYEKFKVLAVTGGVPKYLEEIRPELTAEENIRLLCFEQSGFLFNEFEHVFTDIFAKRSESYKRIVLEIAGGHYEYGDIYRKLGSEKGGTVGNYLDDLAQAGFVSRDYTWLLDSGRVSKLSRFRIRDNYLRFYLKYILPNKDRIVRHTFDDMSLSSLPGWDTVMGLQFENLVLSNRQYLWALLGIQPQDIVYDNPFFQRKTARQAGCQVDYMIQTRHDTLYVCEIKFTRQPVDISVIESMRDKLNNISVPSHISKRPVLIYVNGVSDAVVQQNYFVKLINFSELLGN